MRKKARSLVRKGIARLAFASAVLAGAACALVAPRPRSDGRQRTWEHLRRFRYAHRGLYDPSLGIPENSLAAFERAASLGFGSELDVHLTSDGKLVVVHDSDLARMTGVHAIVEELSLAQIGELRLSGTDEHIPLFSDVLAAYERLGSGLPLIVEVKTYGENYAQLTSETMAELDRHDLSYCVESFDPRVVRWLREMRPEVFRGQLSQNFLAEGQGSGKGTAFDIAATLLAANALTRPDFVAYRFDDAELPAPALATRVLGGAYVGWTLHTIDEIRACEDRGGVAIFEGFVPEPESSAYSKD